MKKIISIILCLTLSLSIAIFATGCNNNGGKSYSVTVTGGSGGGDYYENNICKVIADTPEDKQFMKWVMNGESVSSAKEFSFKVTEDVEMTAVFGNSVTDIDKEVFVVKTEGGLGDGGYFNNSPCTVKVPMVEEDRKFDGWYEIDGDGVVSKEAISTVTPYTFNVTKDIKMVAKFNDIRLDTPFGTLCRISSTPAWGDAIVELDRVKDKNGTAITTEDGKPATMFDGRIQCILIYVYDSLYTTKSIGQMKFVQDTADINNAKLTTLDGTVEFTGIKGGAGNYYRDWISMKDIAPFMQAVVGSTYSSETTYYFASQLIAVEEAVEWGEGKELQFFANSKISELNKEYFREKK